MGDRTYDWNGHTSMPISYPDLSDFHMAGKVRMLMRSDLDHESVVCGARDRIMCLSKEKADLKTEVEQLRAGIKRLSDEEELCAETTGDDPFSMVYLAAKLARTEAECTRLQTAMKQVEDYHRAKSSEIWEVSRDGLSDDQKKEYGIAWCVHAASAYAIKMLVTPDASGGEHA